MERLVTHNIQDRNSLPFCKTGYSEFKYGLRTQYEKYAKELAETISEWLSTQDVASVQLYGAPYKRVRAASNILSDFVMNRLRMKHRNIKFSRGRINRTHSYHGDYGKMDADTRRQMLKNENFEFVTKDDKVDLAIFIDDIFISGAHEEMILNLLERVGFTTPFKLAYYAKLSDPNCPPEFESELNGAVFEIMDIPTFMNRDIMFNTRNVKFFLSQPVEDLKRAYDKEPHSRKWNQLAGYAMLNDYHTHELYEECYNFLKSKI